MSHVSFRVRKKEDQKDNLIDKKPLNESIKNKAKTNNKKKIIGITFSLILILGFLSLIPFLFNFVDRLLSNSPKDIKDDDINDINNNSSSYFLTASTPLYTRRESFVLIESNCSDFIQSVEFFDSEHTLLNNSRFAMSNISISPSYYLMDNELKNVSNNVYNLSTSPGRNFINGRVIFDISNYSFNNYGNYTLNLDIRTSKVLKYNISLFQYFNQSPINLMNESFNRHFNYTKEITNYSPYLDFSLLLYANTSFSMNVSTFLTRNENLPSNRTIYKITGLYKQGIQEIITQITFNQTLNVNKINISQYNITLMTHVDYNPPILTYTIINERVIYNISDNNAIFGVFTVYYNNISHHSIWLNNSGIISFNNSINSLRGVFFIYDISGNHYLYFLDYSNSSEETPDKGDEINDDTPVFLSFSFFISFAYPWSLIIIFVLFILSLLGILLSKFSNKKSQNKKKNQVYYFDSEIRNRFIQNIESSPLKPSKKIFLINIKENFFLFFIKILKYNIFTALIKTLVIGIILNIFSLYKVDPLYENLTLNLLGFLLFITFFVSSLLGHILFKIFNRFMFKKNESRTFLKYSFFNLFIYTLINTILSIYFATYIIGIFIILFIDYLIIRKTSFSI